MKLAFLREVYRGPNSQEFVHKYTDTVKCCCIKCNIWRPPQLSEPSFQGEVIPFMRYICPKAHIFPLSVQAVLDPQVLPDEHKPLNWEIPPTCSETQGLRGSGLHPLVTP